METQMFWSLPVAICDSYSSKVDFMFLWTNNVLWAIIYLIIGHKEEQWGVAIFHLVFQLQIQSKSISERQTNKGDGSQPNPDFEILPSGSVIVQYILAMDCGAVSNHCFWQRLACLEEKSWLPLLGRPLWRRHFTFYVLSIVAYKLDSWSHRKKYTFGFGKLESNKWIFRGYLHTYIYSFMDRDILLDMVALAQELALLVSWLIRSLVWTEISPQPRIAIVWYEHSCASQDDV